MSELGPSVRINELKMDLTKSLTEACSPVMPPPAQAPSYGAALEEVGEAISGLEQRVNDILAKTTILDYAETRLVDEKVSLQQKALEELEVFAKSGVIPEYLRPLYAMRARIARASFLLEVIDQRMSGLHL